MTDWVVTVPKKVRWEDYEKELRAVQDGSQVMNYRLPPNSKVKAGDRCFIVYDGEIRGWMNVVNVIDSNGFTCSTTGQEWPPGRYMQRTGIFHHTISRKMKGFQGVRRLDVGHDWEGRNSDASMHPYYPYIACKKCSIVQRADKKNGLCPGVVGLSLR